MRFLLLALLLITRLTGAAAPAPVTLADASRAVSLGPIVEVFAQPPGQAPLPWAQAVRQPAARWQQPVRGQHIRVFPQRGATYWVRCQIRAGTPAGTPWLLVFTPTTPQAYEVFLLDSVDHLLRRWSFDALHSTAASYAIPSNRYNVDLGLRPGRTVTLLIRTSSGSLLGGLYPPHELIDTLTTYNVGAGLYFGLLLGLVFYNLLLFFSIRDRAYLHYVGFTTSFGLLQLLLMGLWGSVFGAASFLLTHPWLFYGLLLLTMAFSVSTARTFLETPTRLPRLDGWLRMGFALAAVPLLGRLLQLPGSWLSLLTAVPPMGVAVLTVVAVVAAVRAGYRPARYLLAGWTLMGASIILYYLRTLGVLPMSFLTEYGVRIASALELVLLSLALADRINLTRQERAAAQAAALRALEEKDAAQTAANAALLARADELQRAYAELEASTATTLRLQSLDEAKTRFFTNVSHELRTPLTLILGPLDEMRAGRLPPDTATFDQLHYQSSHLLRLINQLLDVARLEAGQLRLHPQPVELGAWLQLRVNAFASAAASQGLTLALLTPPYPTTVPADADQLEKIVDNLLGNALKFTPPGGHVRVTLTAVPATGEAHITVEDDGPGIEPAHLPHLFDRFYQTDDSGRRAHEGSGIGLALVKELTELHGGTVTVTSRVGHGARFTVALPGLLLPDPAAGEAAPPLPAAEHASYAVAAPPPPQPRAVPEEAPLVVVLDDHPDMRHFVAQCLTPAYRTLTAADGEAGLQLLAETIPDLIITDLMMPQLDGLAFVERLRADVRTSHIPLILLTARTDEASRLDALARGADDYLTKPFSASELRARVANLLAQRRQLRERFGRELFLRPADVPITSADETFLRRVLAVAEQHLADGDYDIEQFARALHLSRMQFYRKLKALTNESPSDFLRRFRLHRAADMLTGQAGSVADVAFATGFNSVSYFGKCFREAYGYPPSEHTARVNAPAPG